METSTVVPDEVPAAVPRWERAALPAEQCLRPAHRARHTAGPGSLLATAPQDLPARMLRHGGRPSLVPGDPQKDGITHMPWMGLCPCQGAPQLPHCSWVRCAAGRGAQAGNSPRCFPRHFLGAPCCPETLSLGSTAPLRERTLRRPPPHRSPCLPPMHRRGPPSPPGTYGPECTRMEPTLSTPASFRLGQALLSSWQRPWKFSCSKMAIWKKAGVSERGTPPPAPRGGGTHSPRPPAQPSPTSAAARTSRCPPKPACRWLLTSLRAQTNVSILLSTQLVLLDVCESLPGPAQCPGAARRGMPALTPGFKQLSDPGSGSSIAAAGRTQRAGQPARAGRHQGSPGGRAPPAQHRFHGSAGRRGQICCVCRGGGRLGVDPFPPAPPAPGPWDASKIPCISHPAPRPLVPLQTAQHRSR